jgi:hypothetical protein
MAKLLTATRRHPRRSNYRRNTARELERLSMDGFDAPISFQLLIVGG